MSNATTAAGTWVLRFHNGRRWVNGRAFKTQQAARDAARKMNAQNASAVATVFCTEPLVESV